jgi:hypothetical protein
MVLLSYSKWRKKMNKNQTNMSAMIETAVKIAKNPAGFYQSMPKAGGYMPPVLFVIVMAALSGVFVYLYSLIGFGLIGGAAIGLGGIIGTIVFSLIGSFVFAAIMFVVWKLMGSNESYQTAYRCVGYAAIAYPVSALLGPIPYLGAVIAPLLVFYLLIIASTEVHGLEKRKTYVVLGILAALVIFSNISTQIALQRMASSTDRILE